MNPPPFALHMGERIAIVMTTSSGLLRSRAATPLDEPDMWDISCLTRSIAMTIAMRWKRKAGSEATPWRTLHRTRVLCLRSLRRTDWTCLRDASGSGMKRLPRMCEWLSSSCDTGWSGTACQTTSTGCKDVHGGHKSRSDGQGRNKGGGRGAL